MTAGITVKPTRLVLRGFVYEAPTFAVWIVVDLVTRKAVAGGVTGSRAVAQRRVTRTIERLVGDRVRAHAAAPAGPTNGPDLGSA